MVAAQVHAALIAVQLAATPAAPTVVPIAALTVAMTAAARLAVVALNSTKATRKSRPLVAKPVLNVVLNAEPSAVLLDRHSCAVARPCFVVVAAPPTWARCLPLTPNSSVKTSV